MQNYDILFIRSFAVDIACIKTESVLAKCITSHFSYDFEWFECTSEKDKRKINASQSLLITTFKQTKCQ